MWYWVGDNIVYKIGEKQVSERVSSQNNMLTSSNDSGINGVHKKHRQPKQRVEISSKVSSSEKESTKQKSKGKFEFNLKFQI